MDKKRVMLKLSGEALSNSTEFCYDNDFINGIIAQIKIAMKENNIVILVGGGNIIRGKILNNIDKYKADQIGMLSTVMNCIYLAEMFRKQNIDTYMCSAFQIGGMIDLFNKDKANEELSKNKIILFSGGTGHPYFTTDSGIILRAIEMDCKEVLLAKSIDGVYDSDPKINKNAKKYDVLTFKEMLSKELRVIDLTSSALCEDNDLTIKIFKLSEENSIIKAINGEKIGTIIKK